MVGLRNLRVLWVICTGDIIWKIGMQHCTRTSNCNRHHKFKCKKVVCTWIVFRNWQVTIDCRESWILMIMLSLFFKNLELRLLLIIVEHLLLVQVGLILLQGHLICQHQKMQFILQGWMKKIIKLWARIMRRRRRSIRGIYRIEVFWVRLTLHRGRRSRLKM